MSGPFFAPPAAGGRGRKNLSVKGSFLPLPPDPQPHPFPKLFMPLRGEMPTLRSSSCKKTPLTRHSYLCQPLYFGAIRGGAATPTVALRARNATAPPLASSLTWSDSERRSNPDSDSPRQECHCIPLASSLTWSDSGRRSNPDSGSPRQECHCTPLASSLSWSDSGRRSNPDSGSPRQECHCTPLASSLTWSDSGRRSHPDSGSPRQE